MQKKNNIPDNKISVNKPPAKQLLDKKAEEYLREAGNIEDLPNAEEQEEVEKIIEDTKKKQQQKK
jgi:hypothetical protein